MADYITSINFTAKDSLPSGDPQKIIKVQTSKQNSTLSL
jgi:hypothetical protein